MRPPGYPHRRLATFTPLFSLVILLVLLTLTGCGRAREADNEYERAIEQIESIQSYIGDQEMYELTLEDLEWLENEFADLSNRVDNMEDLASLPLGLDRVAEYGSPRYRAMMDMLEVAKLLAESGQIIANVGHEALTALEEKGIRFEESDAGETWLEVIQRRNNELDNALEIMDQALAKRGLIDESELPGRVQGNLAQVDEMITRFESQIEFADQRPLAYEALGANDARRYLILFQNPAELRPTGGFVGTIAELELYRGQIYSYDFQDVYDISSQYRESEHEVEPPWGIRQFVRSDKLQFQDANWWTNFPDSAQLLMEMAAASGWDELHGVAAIQPETIQDMIAITGPITVTVDGDERAITRENLLDESERQRRLERTGEQSDTGHKEVIEVIADLLIDQLSFSDRDDLIAATFLMFDRLDQRDMQAYHVDDDVQAFLEGRNWAGLLEPQPGVSTLSATFANVTGLKTSLAMRPSMYLSIADSADTDSLDVTMTISLEHTGSAEGDPFYEGFQRYLIDVSLPEGSEIIESEGRFAEDPEASNGGAYVVNLDVGERQEIAIQFSMPAEDTLLLRRQPGLVTSDVTIERDGFDESLDFSLDRDYTISLEHCLERDVFEVED